MFHSNIYYSFLREVYTYYILKLHLSKTRNADMEMDADQSDSLGGGCGSDADAVRTCNRLCSLFNINVNGFGMLSWRMFKLNR